MVTFDYEIGRFNRSDNVLYELLKDVVENYLHTDLKRGIALSSVLTNEEDIEKLSNYSGVVYGFSYENVPVLVFLPVTVEEFFNNLKHGINAVLGFDCADCYPKGFNSVYDYFRNKNYLIAIPNLYGDWQFEYQGYTFQAYNDGDFDALLNSFSCCIDYAITETDMLEQLSTSSLVYSTDNSLTTGVYFGNYFKDESALSFKSLESYNKTIIFNNLCNVVRKDAELILTLRLQVNCIFNNIDMKFVDGYSLCYFNEATGAAQNISTAKDLPKLLYYDFSHISSYSKYYMENVKLFDKVFCEQSNGYASLDRSSFRRPYSITERFGANVDKSYVYVDGNLSVDRAIIKARQAIRSLGLNPFVFKYNVSSMNLLALSSIPFKTI